MKRIETVIFEKQEAWLDYLCISFKKVIDTALTNKSVCHIALSGGSTPTPFYERLSKEHLPWEKIVFWLGDERWVDLYDPQSNEGMILRAFGETSKKIRFYGWHLSHDPQQAASLYEKLMIEKMGDPPLFDLILLGIGEDGHIASLFPGSQVLEENKKYTSISLHPSDGQIRVTFTFPLLNQALQVWFLVSGNRKQKIIEDILSFQTDVPAAKLTTQKQLLIWLKDHSS
ncbi:6-phosphogluconolactonase [Methylacidiphilum caldifontis]|uniref:6-phosphogluconolactonase n=1 Tax=Methylacidiphilum caldifontis TaxID=2795386 RepID=A0A4Y8PJZ8_9BACT|nr:6-phosphogluconolactonase [Methylacidiphilum caldifontis]QSR88671.1 6-phosphogluconolactonase [Methylacidiphilum caldifontis]TFE73312.1 6-phosphogluconolactonase [Methylacidiphilum caldifontis]